jgi:hypothetical protein
MNTDKHGLKRRLLSAFICFYLWPKLFFSRLLTVAALKWTERWLALGLSLVFVA